MTGEPGDDRPILDGSVHSTQAFPLRTQLPDMADVRVRVVVVVVSDSENGSRWKFAQSDLRSKGYRSP